MKRIFAILGISLLAANSLSYGRTGEPKLAPTEKAYILSRFCVEVKYNFAFYDKLTFSWDSICSAAMPALVSTQSDEEFIRGMQALCARLNDGHTYVFELNNPSNPDDWICPFPMKSRRIGDKVFVTDVYSTVLQEQGVQPGCEILGIDGENVLEYAEKHIMPYMASSTPQWSEYRPFAEYELTKDKRSKVSEIRLRNKNGKEFAIESSRDIPWDLQTNSSTINLKVLRENVGLMKIGSFQNSDFSRSYFDEVYNDILKTDALIIDIRGNSGGNSLHADYLIRHFCTEPIPKGKWRSPKYIAAHGSWNYPKEWHVQDADSIDPIQDKEIYRKPVVLLVDACTFSSAEDLCVSFRGARRGKIVGTPTGGSTGNPIFIDLGGGIACCICTKHEVDADGNEFVGLGIQPDIIVREDAAAFLKGKDNLIEAALEVLVGL